MSLNHLFVSLSLCLPLLAPRAQEGSPHQQRMAALEHVLASRAEDTLGAFVEEHLATTYVEALGGQAAAIGHVRAIREQVQPFGGVSVMVREGRVQLHLKGRERESVVAFELEESVPHRIVELVLESSGPREGDLVFTWETLEGALEAAEQEGFCGSVLAVRDGKVVLDRGYGHADPERRHPVTPDTLFAIGSTPIDFTHGALLKLEETGALTLADPIARWFEDVPADKQDITLEHLRSGRSGLIDFPGIDGVDENMDLSWIDRDEFLRRVFSSKLLFEPGSEERHSHMAWGLLAAVIEVASGQGYEDYLRETFFEPAGMDRTGHYPLAREFPPSQVAVGLGGNTWGKVNSPQYWGETSWLVLGSGGMVSTPRDLRSWRLFLLSADGLGGVARRKYGIQGAFRAEGGNDRGFINTIGSHSGDLVIVCSNSHVAMDDHSARVANAAVGIASGD